MGEEIDFFEGGGRGEIFFIFRNLFWPTFLLPFWVQFKFWFGIQVFHTFLYERNSSLRSSTIMLNFLVIRSSLKGIYNYFNILDKEWKNYALNLRHIFHSFFSNLDLIRVFAPSVPGHRVREPRGAAEGAARAAHQPSHLQHLPGELSLW